ncbi:group 1 truncated hemoglobin [Halobacteriales archaeon QS_5_70_17]|jgi:hemoglobin|nr:MAG: group 1 truncated hemoglobin [Halobacteriales archaeon QS_5_70_17]
MSESDEVTYDNESTGDEEKIPDYEGETLYERLGGVYGIAAAVDDLVDRLYENDTANQNPVVREFHEEYPKPGFKYLVTAWAVEYSGGPSVYPGRGMQEAHEDLEVSEIEFDVVRTEIKTTLYQVGVPEPELREFMNVIDMFRDEVVADKHRDENWETP